MAYDVSALPAYTKQDASKVIFEKLFKEIPLYKYAGLQTGIKTAETINIVSTRPEIQTWACSFNASGNTTFTQRTITVGKSKAQMKWCEDDLETKFTSEALKKGGDYTSLTYNTQIIDDTMQYVKTQINEALWLGDTASGDQNLKQFDGLVKIIGAATIGGTYSGTAWSEANSRTVMKGLAALVTANKDVWMGGNNKELKFFCSPAVKQAYIWKLVADNMFHYNPSSEDAKVYVEGTTIEIVADPGLAGTNYIYAIEGDNIVIGTDLANEEEKYKVWFSDDNQELRFSAKWKCGVQVAFPTRIYKYLGV